MQRAYGPNRVGTLDTAVIARKADGTERIYRHSAPPRSRPGAAVAEGDWGLASGLAVALFPSIWIGAGSPTLAASEEIGAIAACVTRGLGRGALSDLGERLDAVDAALVVAAPETTAEPARTAMTSAESILSRGAAVDLDRVEAILAAGGGPRLGLRVRGHVGAGDR